MHKMLIDKFQLFVPDSLQLVPFTPFQLDRYIYVIADVTNIAENFIRELYVITTYLASSGFQSVCQFIPSTDDTIIVQQNSKDYCLLANLPTSRNSKSSLATELSRFHYYGKALSEPIREINRTGKWKQLWEKRLLQLERVWQQGLTQLPDNEFEKMFLKSFPYYLGLTENAIQYLVDTEIDDAPHYNDSGTVCHKRFSEKEWGDEQTFINPFSFVFDHCSRDLAEWTRNCYFQNKQTYEPLVSNFYEQYQYRERLSSFAWRLIFSRLMFPLHYFECIENYYTSQSEHEKNLLEETLAMIISQSAQYEQFLARFYEIAKAPAETYQLPIVEWLYSY